MFSEFIFCWTKQYISVIVWELIASFCMASSNSIKNATGNGFHHVPIWGCHMDEVDGYYPSTSSPGRTSWLINYTGPLRNRLRGWSGHLWGCGRLTLIFLFDWLATWNGWVFLLVAILSVFKNAKSVTLHKSQPLLFLILLQFL